MNDSAPLRTASVEVKYVDKKTDRPLDVKRPLILAVGFAHMYRDQTDLIKTGKIPTYWETRQERVRQEQKRTNHTYRGNRYD